MDAMEPARVLWAKSGDGSRWLSLLQHLSDSCSVAGLLWDSWVPLSIRSLVSEQTGLTDEECRSILRFLAGAHDCGKATMTFQMLASHQPEYAHLAERVRDAGLSLDLSANEQMIPRFRHEMASGILLRRWAMEQGCSIDTAKSLASIVDAHHGKSSEVKLIGEAEVILDSYPENWQEVQRYLLDRAADESGIRSLIGHLPELPIQTQNLFAGIVIAADWIASNEEAFPLETVHDQESRIEAGCRAIDLTVPWTAEGSVGPAAEFYRERFGWGPEMAPRPAQEAMIEAAKAAEGPALLILEAPTGNGKTEAAFAAAEILAEKTGAGGVMVAAPTMSTANGLFERFLSWIRRATPSGEVSSLFLAHSRASLNEDYHRLRFRGIDADAPSSGGDVVASQWMSGRKKGILSTFVVGTVDQVLLMALQSKHSMLRHLGLAGKVIIVDEVHSYDAYMSSYLKTALTWLASYGASVILLSATLPVGQKEQLAHAYQQGLPGYRRKRGRQQPLSLSHAYPAITSVTARSVDETPVPLGEVELTAGVSTLEDSPESLVDAVGDLLADGGCALIICNTVKRAQAAFTTISDRFPGEVELHHAVFLASDRSRREDALRAALGPQAHRGSGRPERRIVVATQVAEQSLDIDADVLITDIAPVDLLIQRIGRLHRHSRPASDRPAGLQKATVLIRGILTDLSPSEAPEFDGGAIAVYGARMLLATAALLHSTVLADGFQRPHSTAPLVQQAYGPDPEIPAGWEETWAEACADDEKRRKRQEDNAKTWRFPQPRQALYLDALFSRFYDDRSRSASDAEAFGLAQVRDSTPSLEVIPIIRTETGYRPFPWVGDREAALVDRIPDAELDRRSARDLAGSIIRLPGWVGRNPQALDVLIAQLERGTPLGWRKDPFLRGMIALPFDEDLTTDLQGRALRYSPDLGLIEIAEDPHRPRQHPEGDADGSN